MYKVEHLMNINYNINYNNDWISPKAVTGYDTCGLCDPPGYCLNQDWI